MCSCTLCKSCWPSSRLIVIVNGLNPAAWMLVIPPASEGANGNGLAHALPFGPETMLNVEDAFAVSLPDHGAMAAVVVYAPHALGVDKRSAIATEKKWSFKSSNGSCGVLSNVATSWPVTGSGVTFPASFTSVPDTGSSTTMYIATSDPNGFAFCAARYAAPSSLSGDLTAS